MKPHHLRRKLNAISNSRWAAYAAAGAASALGGAHSADAEIHYSGVIDSRFYVQDAVKRFDLVGDAKLVFVYGYGVTYNGDGYYGALFGINGAAVSNEFRGYAAAFGSIYASKIAPGKPVSQGDFFQKSERPLALLGSSYGAGAWGSHGQGQGRAGGFIGFRFDNGNGTQYGWARLRIHLPILGVGNGGFDLVDYAWGDPGDTIVTGQTSSTGDRAVAVPDSGSLGALALGGVGVRAWRQTGSAAR